MIKEIPSCSVFIRKKDILVASLARTAAGFEIITDPVFKLVGESAFGVGKAVLECIKTYQVDVASPGPGMAKLPNPLLRIAGCKSWSQLEKRSLNVLVNLDSESISAIPTRHEVGGGFSHLNDLVVKCEMNAEEVGHAVLKAASLSS
jgi:hypothetical protein